MAEKERGFREVERSFELEMYKLIAIVTIVVLVSVGLGAFLGNKIGHAKGINSVDIEVPDYCHLEGSGEKPTVKCGTELKETTVNELCNVLSSSLKENIKVLLIS